MVSRILKSQQRIIKSARAISALVLTDDVATCYSRDCYLTVSNIIYLKYCSTCCTMLKFTIENDIQSESYLLLGSLFPKLSTAKH